MSRPRVRPDLTEEFSWRANRDLRAEIARVVPAYAGIEGLERTGDAIQWGGRHLCGDGHFPTPSGRAAFSVVEVPSTAAPPGMFHLTTRRGKQFNSILWAQRDPLTGAGRDAVYMDPADAANLGLAEGSPVVISTDDAQMSATVHLAPLPQGDVQVHWPEGNILLPGGAAHREPSAGIPDYQALVRISPA